MIILRLLLVLVILLFTVGGVVAATDSATAAPDTPTVSRHEVLAKDTAYQQFVLDSMAEERRAKIDELEAVHGTGFHRPEPEAIIGVFIPIIAILAVFLFLWRSNEAKKAVRLAMVERGMDPGLLNEQPNESSRKYGALRIGMLLMGLGFGCIVGFLVSIMLMPDHGNFWPLVIIASSISFGGAGLIAYHRMATKLEQSKG
jgi:hypothetical protein